MHPETREVSQLVSVSWTRSDASNLFNTVIVRSCPNLYVAATTGEWKQSVIQASALMGLNGLPEPVINKPYSADGAEGCVSPWCPKQLFLHLNVYVL